MKRTRFFFVSLALVGLTIGGLLADRGLAQSSPSYGICGQLAYSTDAQFACPTTATCYGPGNGTCTYGSGTFPYVQEQASKYAMCVSSSNPSNTCGKLISSVLCTSQGYPNMNAFGECYGGAICPSTVTLPGCNVPGAVVQK